MLPLGLSDVSERMLIDGGGLRQSQKNNPGHAFVAGGFQGSSYEEAVFATGVTLIGARRLFLFVLFICMDGQVCPLAN